MGDSDDEYDRKRRDKFRGERSAGGSDSYRSERRDDRRGAGSSTREDWSERNPFRGGTSGSSSRPRTDYRDYRPPARDRYGSPGREMPPVKRMRTDWGEDLRPPARYASYDPYLLQAWNDHYAAAQSSHGSYGHMPHAHPRESAVPASDTQTQPPMLTLKQFLETQDDNISDSEVMRKYSEYKLDFKRQQLNEFFVAHKDEEWFKNKYHPVDSVKRREEQQGLLMNRVHVFTGLLEDGSIKKVTVDTTQQDQLIRLLDTAVIKMEGGTDDDLKILDEKPRDIIFPDRTALLQEKRNTRPDDDVTITSVGKRKASASPEPVVVSPRTVRKPASDDENWDDDDDKWDDDSPKKQIKQENDNKPKDETPERVEKSNKRKRKRNLSGSSSSSSSSSSSESSSSSSSESDDESAKDKYDLGKVKRESPEKEKQSVADDSEEDESYRGRRKSRSTTPVSETVKSPAPLESSLEETKQVENGSRPDTPEKPASPVAQKTPEGSPKHDNGLPAEATIADAATPPTPISPILVEKETEAEVVVEQDKPNETTKELEVAAEPVADAAIEKVAEEEEKKVDEPVTIDLDLEKDKPRPRALHRTSSIFLRNLAPTITKADIENICKRFDGFLRVCIADPSVERRWYRRGWVTFQRDVNIKEYCWSMNNMRLRECEMGAIVNRDLSRRVRPVNGMTGHKPIVRADIKLCAKVILNLDSKFNLWNDDKAEQNGKEDVSAATNYGFKSNNPVLQNITDYLIEEASAEEEELLGLTGESKEGDADALDRDPVLISVLDALILYLRIVHSVDFYNHCEYPYEDEMPNRCGIIHARGPAPPKVVQSDVQEHIKNFEGKMQQFLTKTTTIEEEELKNLGCKDSEAEVEKFIQANTQELAKDKWVCPLSGKKFKGPEFIRKHIFNKHSEKVEEVRKEVEYFNNYLRDPKRPQLPEHPGAKKRHPSESAGGYRAAPAYPPMYPPPYAPYAPLPMMAPRGGMRGYGPRRPGGEHRQIIQYRDLDAPQDPVDMFL